MLVIWGIRSENVNRIEKDKDNRQYFRTSAFSIAAIHNLPDHKHRFHKEPSYQGRNRVMGDVPFHGQSSEFLLGHRYHSIAFAFIPQKQDLQETGRT